MCEQSCELFRLNPLQPIVPKGDLTLHDDKYGFWNHFETDTFIHFETNILILLCLHNAFRLQRTVERLNILHSKHEVNSHYMCIHAGELYSGW